MSGPGDAIRVLHVVEDPMTAGIILEPIIRRQRARGYEVEIVTGPGEYSDVARSLGVPCHEIGFGRGLASPRNLSGTLRLLRLIRARRYDVVHVHTPVAGFFGRLAAWLARGPIVIHHLRGSLWGIGGARPVLYTAFEWIAGRWTSFTFTINSADAADLVAYRIRPADRVVCLRCGSGGLNTSKFDPSRVPAEETARVRQELGIGPDEIVVGFIGRFIRRKGVTELLDAFAQLTGRFPQARLVLVGGALASSRDRRTPAAITERVQADARLQERVVVTGFRRDTPALLTAMDVLVLPSHFEGFGMVLLEANAMGVPVVSTATRGGSDAVAHGQSGLLVPVHDVAALRDAIATLVEDRDLRRSLGAAGRERALKEFNESIVFERMDEAYRRMLRARGHAAAVRTEEDDV